MNVVQILKAAWFTPGLNGRMGLAMLTEGKSGIGKSQQFEGAGRSCGLHVETVIASLREPADFLGLPIPREGGYMEYMAPSWAVRAAEAVHAVVFFDEMSTAPPAVQAALLRTILDGVVGDLVLPKTVRFVGAMNSTADAAGGWDLAAPLANRFGHLPMDSPDAASWSDWLLGHDRLDDLDDEAHLDPVAEEKRVMAAWAEPYAKARGLVSAFIKARPVHLHNQPDAGSPQASKAWPSPRTWEMFTRALASSEIHKLDAIDRDEFVSSFVGGGPCGEFLQFLDDADLPDPAALLDGNATFEHDPRRLDRTVAVLSAGAALVSPANAAKRNKRAAALWQIMEPLSKDAIDVVVPAGRVLANAGLYGMPEAQATLTALQPVLKKAGLRRRRT